MTIFDTETYRMCFEHFEFQREIETSMQFHSSTGYHIIFGHELVLPFDGHHSSSVSCKHWLVALDSDGGGKKENREKDFLMLFGVGVESGSGW